MTKIKSFSPSSTEEAAEHMRKQAEAHTFVSQSTELSDYDLRRLGRVLHDPSRKRDVYLCGSNGSRICVNGAHFYADQLFGTLMRLVPKPYNEERDV